MKRISDETLNKMIGWRLSGAKPLELVDNDDIMNLIEDLRDARERADKEAHVRNVFVGGALEATNALVLAERRAEEAEAEVNRLTAVTIAYWARFGAVPEDGEQIFAKARAEIDRLRQALVHVLADLKEIRDDYGSGMHVTDVTNTAITIVERALEKEPAKDQSPLPARPEKTTCPHCRTLYRPGERHACASRS